MTAVTGYKIFFYMPIRIFIMSAMMMVMYNNGMLVGVMFSVMQCSDC